MKKITRIVDLNHALADGKPHEFKLLLAGGLLFSRKTIHRNPSGTYSVFNHIDDTRQQLSAQDFRTGTITNIGKAIDRGVFYLVA